MHPQGTKYMLHYFFLVLLTGLPIGYSVIVALTGLPIGYSVIVALTGLPIGYSVIWVSLSELHHVRLTVKSVFLLACLIACLYVCMFVHIHYVV